MAAWKRVCVLLVRNPPASRTCLVYRHNNNLCKGLQSGGSWQKCMWKPIMPEMCIRISHRFLTFVYLSFQTWILASTWHVIITACVKRLDQMMPAALLLTIVHPTKNQSAHQMAQHTTTRVCFDRKCAFSDWISLCNTLVVVKVRNSFTLKFLMMRMKTTIIIIDKPV